MLAQQTVFIVDDDPGVREALCFLYKSVNLDAEAFATAEEFLNAYNPQRSGCLILDVRLPGMSGFGLMQELSARKITLPIIMITGHGDVTMAVHALKSGVLDYVTKPFNEQTLLERTHEALKQDALWRQRHQERTSVEKRFARLTPREQEVMLAVIEGKPNKVTAAELGVSPKTVEQHRAHVMKKMEAGNLAVLVRMGLLLRQPDPIPIRSADCTYRALTA